MGRKSRKNIQKEKEIKISYVLPTYNRVEYLGECIATLLEQDFNSEEFEIIIVDDGSTDTTEELMCWLCSQHKNLHYYKKKHAGVESARNFGNKLARAEIIGVCDSDDLYHQDRTKITYNYFKQYPNVDILTGSYIEINHRGLPLKVYKAEPIKKRMFFKGRMTFFCHDNCAYKKEKILKTPYRKNGNQTDDWKLIHDWLKANYKFGYTKKELCKVRTLRNGIMGARRERMGIRLSYV